jgi:hypothetical protein
MVRPYEGMSVVVHASAYLGDRQEGVVSRVNEDNSVDVDVDDDTVVNVRYEQSDPLTHRMPTNYENYCFPVEA